jgi:hypothetical protein
MQVSGPCGTRYVNAVDLGLFIVSCILLLVQLVSACTFLGVWAMYMPCTHAIADTTGGLTNLMRVVYRDGVIFYIVLLCTLVPCNRCRKKSHGLYLGFSVVNIFAIVMLPADISSLLTA